jgi:hypothetical protein
MNRLIDYDPVTGIQTFHEYSDGKTHITEKQDVQGILDYTTRLANDSSYKSAGIKSDWYHFATVPNVVIMEIKEKYNLDVFKNEDMPKIEKVLQRDYKRLLTVNRI